jgi:hypothetical protein
VISFVETARKFIDGAGVFEAWKKNSEALGIRSEELKVDSDTGSVQDTPAKSKPRTAADPEKVWEGFTVYLERLVKVPEEFGSGKSAPQTGVPGPDGKPGFQAENPLSVSAYAYAVLSLLRPIIGEDAGGADAVSLALHWQLDRKLREILGQLLDTSGSKLGIEGETLWHSIEIMKAVLKRLPSTKPSGAAEPKRAEAGASVGAISLAQTLLLDNYDKEDFRRILGVNVFDDVTWFNKECFDRALSFGSLFAVMETGDFALIKKVDVELRKAEAKSGYDLTQFIEALTPTVKPKVTIKVKARAKPGKAGPGK